ncbi:MAG: 30S ribosomal protein S6 [Anaerolineae bacterium]|nr:30S ribosomal protein S6 [Anaerolineae bacterium]
MRTYELMLVVRADLSEDDLATQLETVKGWIETNGGKIVEADHWGTRRLAYEIEGHRDGYYVVYTLDLPTTAPVELERVMGISENVLRYMITRADEKPEAPAS